MSDAKIILIKKTQKSKSGGGARKIGRNMAGCSRYRSANVREKNKIRRFLKHLKTSKQFKLWDRVKGMRDWETVHKLACN